MRVFLHTRSTDSPEWRNEPKDFARIPSIGEYVATSSDGPWYRVALVLHLPFACDFDAEVYCEEVDHVSALSAALPDSR